MEVHGMEDDFGDKGDILTDPDELLKSKGFKPTKFYDIEPYYVRERGSEVDAVWTELGRWTFLRSIRTGAEPNAYVTTDLKINPNLYELLQYIDQSIKLPESEED